MMKQDKVKMNLKTWLVCTPAALAIAVVSTLANAQTNATVAGSKATTANKMITETAPPPVPFSSEKAPVKAEQNFPPADFDPEKKVLDSGQKTKATQPVMGQKQWPAVTGNETPTKEYPPQEGVDLTPATKPALKKPELKYPEFPSVAWPKKNVTLPEYAPFPSVKFSPQPATGPADQKVESQAAIAAADARRAEAIKAQQAELQKARADFEAWRAEQEKILKARQSALRRQWESQQAEIASQRAAMETAMKAERARQENMARELAEQQAAAKARISKMLESAETSKVPPLPPKTQAMPDNGGANNGGAKNRPPARQRQWQYRNQMPPAWGYNQFGPQYRPQFRPQYRPQYRPRFGPQYWPQHQYQNWPRPYPYGPGFYRPR